MKATIEVKIKAVSGIYTSATVGKPVLRKILVTVIEVPESNPYGSDYTSKAVPFDIEVHNSNIESMGISPKNIGDHANVELILHPHKKDANTAADWKLLVNKLNYIL